MPWGLLLLFALAAIIFFGLAERVLDRMRLTDIQALVFIGLMIAGSYIEIPFFRGSSLNVGGALVPLGLVIYLLSRAGTPRERWRAVIAAVITGIAVLAVGMLMPNAPHTGSMMLIDPVWLFGITAGIVGYLSGRSRRSAFIAGVGGILLADLFDVLVRGAATEIGGAGMFDQIVLAGIIAVGLAELIGESRERLQGGPEQETERPLALRQEDKVEANVVTDGHVGESGADDDDKPN